VGDIIIVHKNHYIPADLLFLSAENDEGICYIETMQLDGETNLKIKKALDETKDMREETIGHFVGTVHCEPPNSRLYQFTGNLDLEPPLVLSPTKLSVTPSAVLLRGCSLRNTNRIFGMVLYAGECTGVLEYSCAFHADRGQHGKGWLNRRDDRSTMMMPECRLEQTWGHAVTSDSHP
jgi:phospholipid-transporting ATPase